MYNPVSRSYGAPHKRPEVQNATIEFIAPSEYMVRPNTGLCCHMIALMMSLFRSVSSYAHVSVLS